MSLSSHLKNPGSPVRAYLDGVSPWFADTQGTSPEARSMAQALGLIELAASRTLVPPPPGTDAARAGTAVDFRARIALGGFDPNDSTAAQGVALMPLYASEGDNAVHRTRVLTEAFEFATQIVTGSPSEEELDCASILLAHCEQVYRAGPSVLGGSLGEVLDAAEDGITFALHIDKPALDDLRTLMETNSHQLDSWRAMINRGERANLNPSFAGSALVGGADADWIVGDTLIESKAYEKITVPALRSFLRQLLGYVILDLEDALHIRRVGVWLPRQGMTRTWSLSRILGGEPETMLPKLRDGFRNATKGSQVAVREPVTQRRKHQILADNKHTPSRMLANMAYSDDTDLRFRVARNAATPETTVRSLAEDRYAKVREGVARNPKTPADVIHNLRRDRSIAVRRAADEKSLGQHQADDARVRQLDPQEPANSASSLVEVAVHSPHALARETGNRDPESLNTGWFGEFLVASGGGRPWGTAAQIPVPFASRRWAWQEGRSLAIPEWLKMGLPDDVKHELMSEDHPAWVRRFIADSLSVADPIVRDALLADSDPEIRWAALCRTVDHPDNALSTMLEELAENRQERTRFRAEGDGLTRWERRGTPAERDLETLALVASHPSTPYPALRELLSSKAPEILVALAANPSLAHDDLEALLARVKVIRSYEIRETLAASPRLPSVAAEVLVSDRVDAVRRALASNQATPLAVLEELANDIELHVRFAVAGNTVAPTGLTAAVIEPLLRSGTDEDLLQVLDTVSRRDDYSPPSKLLASALDRLSRSRLRDPDVRYIVARHVHASPQTLVRLSRCQDEDVRRSVATNINTPPDVLTTLASDIEDSVRAAAASNDALHLNELASLALDDDAGVRAGAAKSPRLDPGALKTLLRDDNFDVRTAAYHNPTTTAEDKTAVAAEWKSAREASVPSREDLEERAANKRAEVRIEVAYDSRTPPDILAFLAGERRSVKVRRAAAANPRSSPAVLSSLADDPDAEVRQSVAFNSSTPVQVLNYLADRGTDLALIVALNPDTPHEVLDRLTGDAEALIKHAATNVLNTRANEIESCPTVSPARILDVDGS